MYIKFCALPFSRELIGYPILAKDIFKEIVWDNYTDRGSIAPIRTIRISRPFQLHVEESVDPEKLSNDFIIYGIFLMLHQVYRRIARCFPMAFAGNKQRKELQISSYAF